MKTGSRQIFDKRLRLALKISAAEVQEEARQVHRYTQRTGRLKDSVETRMQGRHNAIVYLDSGVARYGRFVHEGTKPHRIKPVHRRALRWVGKGRFQFARGVMHPGTKKDPFLYEAFRKKRKAINRIFLRQTGLALAEVAGVLQRKQYTWGG